MRSGACEIGILGSAEPPRAADLDVVELESQALVLISGPDDEAPAGRTVRREDLSGCRLIVSQRGSLMRALVDDVLAEGIEVTIVAEIAHRTSILPMVFNGIGRAVMPSSWTQTARRAGAHVQKNCSRVVLACRRGQPPHPPHHPRRGPHERGPSVCEPVPATTIGDAVNEPAMLNAGPCFC